MNLLFYAVFWYAVCVARVLPLTFWGFVSGGVKDALTFGLRLMFVDITEP